MELIDRKIACDAIMSVLSEGDKTDPFAVMYFGGAEVAVKFLKKLEAIDPVHAAGGCYCYECVRWNGCFRKNAMENEGIPKTRMFCGGGHIDPDMSPDDKEDFYDR